MAPSQDERVSTRGHRDRTLQATHCRHKPLRLTAARSFDGSATKLTSYLINEYCGLNLGLRTDVGMNIGDDIGAVSSTDAGAVLGTEN